MIKIGLISDTHGFLDEKVFRYFEPCDEIWHAGDIGSATLMDQLEGFKPVKAVFGNIDDKDLQVRYPEHLRFRCRQIGVWITHIGGYPPRYTPVVKKQLQEDPPDLFICGHSHILRIMRDPKLDNLLYMNPGAAGRHGFHKVRTLIRFDIDETIRNVQVIELGKRA